MGQEEQNIQLKITPGAGGSESQDVARLIKGMYENWIKRRSSVDHDITYDDGSMVIQISGPKVFDKLKDEHGVHRLVRISPHDPQQRRHTSFVVVEVEGMGEVPNQQQIRNYIFHPYKSVKDLRTGDETDKIEEVMNGNIKLIYNH